MSKKNYVTIILHSMQAYYIAGEEKACAINMALGFAKTLYMSSTIDDNVFFDICDSIYSLADGIFGD